MILLITNKLRKMMTKKEMKRTTATDTERETITTDYKDGKRQQFKNSM